MKINIKIPDKVTSMLDNMDIRQRYGVFAAILGIILVLDVLLIMGPQFKALGKISPKVKKLSTDIEALENDIKQLPQYKASIKNLQGTFDGVNQKVRTKVEIPLILERISSIANANNVKIDQIMPDTQNQELLVENPERQYFTLPITIDARGSYHNYGRFINQIEREEISLSIGSFRVSSNKSSRLHTIQLTLNAVVMEEVSQEDEG